MDSSPYGGNQKNYCRNINFSLFSLSPYVYNVLIFLILIVTICHELYWTRSTVTEQPTIIVVWHKVFSMWLLTRPIRKFVEYMRTCVNYNSKLTHLERE